MDIQHFLKDLLAIDCDMQSNLQNLLLVQSRHELEMKSGEIKRNLREFKEKLKEMKDMSELCDSSSDEASSLFPSSLSSSLSTLSSHLTSRGLRGLLTSSGDHGDLKEDGLHENAKAVKSPSSSSHSSSSVAYESAAAALHAAPSKLIFQNEIQIQKEHLFTIESRFRNTYLAAQVKLDQMERDALLVAAPDDDGSDEATAAAAAMTLKKRKNLDSEMLAKKTSQMTSKLDELNRQIHFSLNQTSDLIPVLDNSSKTIANASQEFGAMTVVIKDGKRLLTRLSQREFTDKLLIILGLCFFFTVVFYIVWKRLF